jgi:phosphoethanolamine N-methyltransferase
VTHKLAQRKHEALLADLTSCWWDMSYRTHTELECKYHESEDRARNDSRLIRGLYGSGIFEQALAYQQDALGNIDGLRVLDYGCGAGSASARLQACGARVTAFDISRTCLAEAQRRVSGNEAEPPVALVQCAAGRMPFADASFDAVFGKWILHHLDRDLPDIVRVLKPRGR